MTQEVPTSSHEELVHLIKEALDKRTRSPPKFSRPRNYSADPRRRSPRYGPPKVRSPQESRMISIEDISSHDVVKLEQSKSAYGSSSMSHVPPSKVGPSSGTPSFSWDVPGLPISSFATGTASAHGSATPKSEESSGAVKQQSSSARTTRTSEKVKYVSESESFANVQSQAMHHWTQGVDIHVKESEQKEKKKSWMTATEWENFVRPVSDERKKSGSSLTSPTSPPVSSPGSLARPPSYAHITARHLPTTNTAASFPQTVSPGHIPFAIPPNMMYAAVPMQEGMYPWQQQQQPINPMTQPHMPNQFAVSPRPPFFHPLSAPHPMGFSSLMNSKDDIETLQFLYLVEKNHFARQTIPKFKKRLATLLPSIKNYSCRTFARLIHALIFTLKEEETMGVLHPSGRTLDDEPHLKNTDKLTVAALIRLHMTPFLAALQNYVQSYVAIPIDLFSLLECLQIYVSIYPDGSEVFPVNVIRAQFDKIQHTFSERDAHQAKCLLLAVTSFANASPGEEWQTEDNEADWMDAWRDLRETLPLLPDANDILAELTTAPLHKFNFSAKDNGADSGSVGEMTRSRIELADAVNFVTEPWPDASLDLYLMIHYMLLREELVGPLRLAINSYIFGKRSNDVTDAVIPGLRIFGTISSPTHTDPLIIFQVQSKMLSTMRHLVKEGALAMLMPEKTVDSDDHQRYLTSMSGKVIHAIVALISSEVNDTNLLSLPDTHLIALHVSPEELKKITWSTTYVMVVGHANANALLPVLSWLREQSLNVELSNISQSIAPRILFVTEDVKEKVISQADNSPYAVNEEDTVPDYLHLPLDLSTVMAPEYAGSRANPSLDDWPRLSEQELLLPPYQRPALYTLSPSQVDALKYALTHRIAVISGDIGTGKTYLASKLVELIYQGLVDSQCFHPVVVITRTEAGLDSILDRVIDTVPDLIRFGSPSEIQRLTERQGIHISVPNVNDPNRRQINSIEKNQAYTQAKLTALWNYRWRVQNGDPSVLVTSMPPSYAEALRSGYRQLVGRRDATASSDEVWSCWLNAEPVDAVPADPTKTPPKSAKQRFNDQWRQAHQSLVTTMIDNKSCRLPDIMETQNYMSRQRWIEKHLPSINALGTATHWPLSQSRQGNAVRGDMTEAWSTIPSHSLWEQTPEQRRNIVQQVIRAMLQNIDKDIDDLLDQQFKASKTLEEARCQKLISTCRFGRVLGMTADFAAANRDFLAALWPKVLIVDEASEILESVIASSALGVRMEHLILLGNGDSDHKPKVWHDPLRGAPSHLDVSLFERWRQSGGEMVNLEEQWRMCEPVAAVFYALQRPSASAALDMEIDNRAEETKPGLLGLDHAVYFIDYAADPQARSINRHMSTFVGATVTEDNMDEARYVCHLALYMMQQSEKSPKLSILVFSPIQKRLLEAYLQYEMPHYSNFSSVVQTIVIHLVDDHVGKEDHVCIVSTAMPCGSSLPNHNMMLALTRARYGLYVVGQSSLMQKAGWDIFIDYMRENDLCSSSLRLRCQKHRKQLLQAGHWKHFAEAKNGGCQEICNTILDCGHVCKEACHHLPHSLLTCKKYCERPRFKGCTHSCPNKCFECEKRKQGCPPCRHQAVLTLPCGHTRSGPCYTLYTSEPAVCDVIVECALPCGHKRMVECHKATSPEAASSLRCSEIEFVTLDCTHVVQTTCGFRPLCTEPCSVTLECGHSCKQKCGTQHTHRREDCTSSCPKQLVCGHYCGKGCRSADEHTDQCLETCQHRCFHGYKCGRYCWQVCSPCLQPCPNVCPHEQCTKKCYEACDRRPCNKSCTKTLPCSHKCSGLCGEPCPPCKKCQPHLQCSISLRTLAEFEENENIYMLPECGCVFSVESLDTYFVTQVKNGKHNAIRLWQCPACQTPIYTALRYNKYVKTEIELVNTIKSQQEKRRQLLTRSEKEGIIQAMNEETRSGRYSVVGGRWFVCENRHPYFIGDCGGATEISRCPQCDVLIGGVDHKVVESNRFYGEFDGCDKPAWPGQPGNQ